MATSDTDRTNVAIACQGGGSHTAFTAGVLQTVLEDVEWDDEQRLVGISGSSGGAFNALATWYGLVTGSPGDAATLLDDLWSGLSADGAGDRALNDWLMAINRLENGGFPLPQLSPYQIPGAELGKERIRSVLESNIDFEAIPDYCEREAPDLVVGTVNVNAGIFETFTNEDVDVDAILASAAVPNLFEAVEIDGHLHWDGMFSQNPPISDLMHQPPDRKPDELWVIQINPQELDADPRSLEEIADRRNELSGNISLNQELRFVEQVNEWVEEGRLPPEEFSVTDVHRIEMGEQFHCSTKLDRDPAFIDDLMENGRSRASEFLDSRED